jgi:hypothetical protein
VNTPAESVPSSTSRPSNPIGIIGMVMVIVAAVFSPTGFCGLPLLILVPLGFGGLIVCLVSYGWKPYWPGTVGLVVGLLTLGGWGGFFWSTWNQATTAASSHGMNIAQHAGASMAAMALAEAGENQRFADGTPAPTFDFTPVPPEYRTDPWGRPYRYVRTTLGRGYTFMSDGPDGIADTADDVDLLKIQDEQHFTLPPKKR